MVKPASLFLLVTSIHGSVRFGACMHAQTMREMAENGVLFDGVESNGGVRASELKTLVGRIGKEGW